MGTAQAHPTAAAGARRRGIHHVQLAIPAGAEDTARDVDVGVHGFDEVPEPPVAGLRQFVTAAGLDVRRPDEIPGSEHCHLDDPFGNRVELIGANP